MVEEKEQLKTIEQVPESSTLNDDDISVGETPIVKDESGSADSQDLNYLNPELFDNIKVVQRKELNEENGEQLVDPELEKVYSGTLIDISENQLINGRVV